MRIEKFFISVRHALAGIAYVFRHEQNFRIQIFGVLAVAALAWIFPLKGSERIVLALLITLILILELVNSAIEKFTDIVKPRLHDQVRVIKDIMAGTVLVASVSACVLGFVIFIPYIIEMLTQ